MSDLIEVTTTLVSALTGETTTVLSMEPAPAPEPRAIPRAISPYQAHMVLLDAGLLADAESAVARAGPAAVIAWNKATEWRRDSPTIAAIAEALELTTAQVDDLFCAAALITA